MQEVSKNKDLSFPSVGRPWLKHYPEGAYERSLDVREDITLWDFIEKRLIEQGDKYPALSYFGKNISRSSFINNVYNWARVLKNMGVKEKEVIPIYTLWVPEVCYLMFALNIIGATPYFLKLSISEKELKKETKDSKFIIVLDTIWANVENVFSDDCYEKVMFLSICDSMPFFKKIAIKAIESKQRSENIISDKYIYASKAKKKYGNFKGNIKCQDAYKYDLFITSSSGTTNNDVVKGVVASNLSALSELISADAADMSYFKGTRVLTNLPPTASTSVECLFLYALHFNETAIICPELSEEGFFDSLIKNRPQVALMTGAFWMAAFRKAEDELNKGNKVDFSFFDMPIMGGEGCTKEDLAYMNDILKRCGSKVSIFSGYGLSEMCSAISADKLNCHSNYEEDVISVGIPYPNLTCGVFDENGEELSYGQRGELWVKSKNLMRRYYNKPEMTKNQIVDGWLHTGDIFSVDLDGYLYCYGRKSDSIVYKGETIYLFDISNLLLKCKTVKYALVNAYVTVNGPVLVSHVVLKDEDKHLEAIKEMEEKLNGFLPAGLNVVGYKFHHKHLKASPTTAKIDRNYYLKDLDGYMKKVGDILVPVKLVKNNDGLYSIK